MATKTAPYGTWVSPISAEAIAKAATSIQDILVDPVTSKIYHLEGRPVDGGRVVVVDTAAKRDVFGPVWDARTGVYEYGGAAAVVYNDVLHFSHFVDGRIYRLDLKGSGEPEPITKAPPPPAFEGQAAIYRYACFTVYPPNPDILVAVYEDHTDDTPQTVINTLVQINSKLKIVTPLIKGRDFYAQPQFSSDGSRLAWQEWDFPVMPWEGGVIAYTEIVSTDSKSIALKGSQIRVGEEKQSTTSFAFPSWASTDTLVFTSDTSGFINPWKYTGGEASPALSQQDAHDFGMPMWNLSLFPYAFIDKEGRYALFAAYKDGRNILRVVDVQNPCEAIPLENDYAVVSYLKVVNREQGRVVFLGKKSNEEPSLVTLTIAVNGGRLSTKADILKRGSSDFQDFTSYITEPKPKVLKSEDNQPIYAVYYPPYSPDYAGSSIPDELPPCIVNVHGGPTGMQEQGLYWNLQYFTTRGFAWLDVNYGGSSGYGRAYIDRLVKNWGIVDVSDCIQAPIELASTFNLVDRKRLVIRGGSSGGYTTLATLSIAPDVTAFAAGTSSYGISDLVPLEEFTHKFESRYMWGLLGGSSQQIPEVYEARSPVKHADRIKSPLLLLQGALDKVVPPDQSKQIRDAIEKNHGRVRYIEYPGEGHGWRKESTIQDALEQELRWYEEVLGLKPE